MLLRRRCTEPQSIPSSPWLAMNSPYTFLLLILLLAHKCSAADPLGNDCSSNSFFNSSKISASIDHLLAQLVSKTASTFYTATSEGKGQAVVYGLSQCRSDVGSQDCDSCIRDAAKRIRESCPKQADARIWYDYCFLRYSQDNFFGKVDTGFGIYYYNVEFVTEPDEFNKKLGKLMDKVSSEAVKLANKGFGKGETKLSSLLTLYALGQCTRDLAPVDCAQCLAIAVGNFPNFCSNRKGCRVLYSSCYVRYELYPFFFPLDSDSSTIGTVRKMVRA